MGDKSDIIEQLDNLEQEVSALAHRLHPYMVASQPTNDTVAAQAARSPVFERIGGVIAQLRELNSRLVA